MTRNLKCITLTDDVYVCRTYLLTRYRLLTKQLDKKGIKYVYTSEYIYVYTSEYIYVHICVSLIQYEYNIRKYGMSKLLMILSVCS